MKFVTDKQDVRTHRRCRRRPGRRNALGRGRPPPLIMVVDVISAKGLLAKDSNGLSDPFCVLGIVALWRENTSEGEKHKMSHSRHDPLLDHASKDPLCVTEVKEKTLCPSWREQFRLDHDENSSVGQLIKKNAGDVSNLKGMGRDLTISSQGLECSFPLQSRGKRKVEGELKLKLQLALKKDAPKASTEAMGATHQYLWYNFTHHEVCDNAMTEYRWSGQLPPAPRAVLHQLAQQQQLPEIYQLASQWIAYSQQCVLPRLDLNVMLSIITGITNLWDKGPPDEQMVTYLHNQWIAYSQQCVLPRLDLNVMLSIITGITNLWDKGPPDEQMDRFHTLIIVQKSVEQWSMKTSGFPEEVTLPFRMT
eukprot:XP_011664212.1 PREDICTED: protein unc-13 homolog D-like [Strongylocentrotus purpuratus]